MIIHPEDVDIEVVENCRWPRRRHSTALELSPPPPESSSPPSPPLSEDFIAQIMLTNDWCSSNGLNGALPNRKQRQSRRWFSHCDFSKTSEPFKRVTNSPFNDRRKIYDHLISYFFSPQCLFPSGFCDIYSLCTAKSIWQFATVTMYYSRLRRWRRRFEKGDFFFFFKYAFKGRRSVRYIIESRVDVYYAISNLI